MSAIIGARRRGLIALAAVTAVAIALAGLVALDSEPVRAAYPLAPVQQTEVEGNIDVDTVWTPAESPYHVTGSVTVKEGVSLTIQSGVTVEFAESAMMRVQGSLFVQGTQPEDVIFTSDKTEKAPGDWPAVEMNSETARAEIRGLTIRNAGQSNRTALRLIKGTALVDQLLIEDAAAGGIFVDGLSMSISNTTVRRCGKEALRVDAPRSDDPPNTVTLTNLELIDNKDEAVRSEADVHLVISGTKASNNGVNGIYINGGTTRGPTTWTGGDLPYVINSTMTAATPLTIGPDTVVKFTSSGSLRVRDGSMQVNGTAEHPVYFTALSDDEACTSTTVDCDTNNNGSATKPDRGSWDKLRIEGPTTGVTLTHAIVRYGKGPVIRVQAENVSLDHVQVYRIEDEGIFIDKVSSSIVDSEIRDAEAEGLVIDADPTNPIEVKLQNNRFCENSIAVRIEDPNVNLLNESNTTRCETDEGATEYTNGLNGYVISGDLVVPETWRATDLPFVVSGRLELKETVAVLTIEPGLAVKMLPDAQIVADRGELRSGESGAKRVLFTSVRDDSCSADDTSNACDTNGDGDRDAPAACDWASLSIRRTAKGAIIYDTVIRYGGDDSISRAQLDIQNSNSTVEETEVLMGCADGVRVYQTDTTLAHNTIRDNKRHGVSLVGGSVPIVVNLESNTIVNNGGHAIDADANVEVVLDGRNIVHDNGRNGIVLHGDSRVSRTWRAGNLPYILTDDVDVVGESTLEIEPGVVIKLENEAILSARDGTLIAEGGDQESKRIVFTSVADDEHMGDSNPNDGDVFPKPGDWGGIDFPSSGGQGSKLTNVDIYYSGARSTPALTIELPDVEITGVVIEDGGYTAVRVKDVGVTLDGLVIKNMKGTGIEIISDEEYIEPTIRNNEITGCGAAVSIDANVEPKLGNNTAEDNNINGILVDGSVDVSRVWQGGDLPFVIADTIRVNQGTLGLEAGLVVKAQLGGFMVIKRGGLLIPQDENGEAMVTMTSIRDDTCGAGVEGTCDTNNDGTNTKPLPGDWRGIKIENGPRNARLKRLWIEYAGEYEAAIVVQRGLVEITDSVIAHSGTDGVIVDDVVATISDNLFKNNVGNGLRLVDKASVTAEGNVFTGNARPIEHRAKGNTVTDNNVAVGNANDAMLYCADVTTSQTWPNDLVREIACSVTVEDGLLELEPGAVLLFSKRQTGIRVKSQLQAEGVTFSTADSHPAPGAWGHILFDDNSRGGFVRHSTLLYGGSNDNVIESKASGLVEIMFNMFRRADEGVIEIDDQVEAKIQGNVIRDINDDRGSAVYVKGEGANREITYNRIANAATGIIASGQAQPLITHNSFEDTGTGVVNKSTRNICVSAQHNWWGAVCGPNDESEKLDACQLKDNACPDGVGVSDDVNYLSWMTSAPPQVPMVEGPRCGVTSNSEPVAVGSTSPHVTVNVYDSNSDTPGTPIATGESDDRGKFQIDLDLAVGEHRISFEAVSGEEHSPVSGFRVIEVQDTDVDPAGIRFEYGSGAALRVQPLRDVAGCSTGCGGPTSGRVVLPKETMVRAHVPISGAPSKVEFVQPGQPVREMKFNGATDTYMTEEFEPVAGPFTIRVDGDSGDKCMGYIYIDRENVVFFDSGASGPPAQAPDGEDFVYDFESGSPGWVPGHPWALIDDADNAHSPTHAWHDSPGGNYRPNSDAYLHAPGPIDLRQVTAPALTFWHKFRLANDQASVEISTNAGQSWKELERYKGTQIEYTGETISLEEYEREARVWLRFRLKSGSSKEDDGWYIDDVAVKPGGALNGRYDPGEPLVPGADVDLERHNVDSGQWVRWNATDTGQINPQTTNELGSYGFYFLDPGEYRITVTKLGLGVHRSAPIIVWDGVFDYDAPLTGSAPTYLPITVKHKRIN
jgi:hypothetical protein